jgi:hypothetical protein
VMDSGVCTVLCAVHTVLRCTFAGNAVEVTNYCLY